MYRGRLVITLIFLPRTIVRDRPLHFSHEVGQVQKNNSSTTKIRRWVSCATKI